MNEQTDHTFLWQTEQFADIRILRYQIKGFEQLSLDQKILVWYLYQAALCGREIIYDQNYKYNLLVKRTLEAIYRNKPEKKITKDWEAFIVYLKRIWFANGIHHHYSMEKFKPGFSREFFVKQFDALPDHLLPLSAAIDRSQLFDLLSEIIFNKHKDRLRMLQTDGTDHVSGSACNFYDGVNQEEAEAFYKKLADKDKTNDLWHGLNTRLVKRDDKVFEEVCYADGRYGKTIRKIVYWLEKAVTHTENEQQKETIQKLIDFYDSGKLESFDEYNIKWVSDTQSEVDFINGFIEVYGDPLGHHGSWESLVYFRDQEATQQFGKISEMAGWFEQHSPIDPQYKRDDAKGISYKVIQVVTEAGDSSPSTPIGINLPNADWIREQHGSKSVSLGNIEDAYDSASLGTGAIEEFYLPEQQERIRKHSKIASKLHTGLHEVIGHGSGKLKPGVGNPKDTLKSYANTLEEARADLVALYYMLDEKLIETGLCDSIEVGMAEYDSFMLNGLMRQLVRLEPGQQLEESHMRNRQLIARWIFEKGQTEKVVEKLQINGKTFFRINDYQKTRELAGQLLREVQRIKSEGDYAAGRELVERYGVAVDKELHLEVLERWKKLNIAPFAGFINPVLQPVKHNGQILDVLISYPDDFASQMLYYADHYHCMCAFNG